MRNEILNLGNDDEQEEEEKRNKPHTKPKNKHAATSSSWMDRFDVSVFSF